MASMQGWAESQDELYRLREENDYLNNRVAELEGLYNDLIMETSIENTPSTSTGWIWGDDERGLAIKSRAHVDTWKSDAGVVVSYDGSGAFQVP